MSFLASAVAYWVGKAKDTVGTVAGQATPGWASGQLWSVSAGQWEGAAWDTGGNPDSHSGTAQLWSATAGAWHSAYNAEVNAYNNEVTLYNNEVATANTWQSRANTAYDSGTWGVGNTWQTDYNNEVTLYNNEVTAYNNALAAADSDYQASVPSRGYTDNGSEVVVNTFQVGRTGLYLLYGWVGFNASNNSLMVTLRVYTSPDNATWTLQSGSGQNGMNSGTQTMAMVPNGGAKVSLNVNNYVQFRIFAFGSSGNTANGNGLGLLHAQFIPTPANPH